MTDTEFVRLSLSPYFSSDIRPPPLEVVPLEAAAVSPVWLKAHLWVGEKGDPPSARTQTWAHFPFLAGEAVMAPLRGLD